MSDKARYIRLWSNHGYVFVDIIKGADSFEVMRFRLKDYNHGMATLRINVAYHVGRLRSISGIDNVIDDTVQDGLSVYYIAA